MPFVDPDEGFVDPDEHGADKAPSSWSLPDINKYTEAAVDTVVNTAADFGSFGLSYADALLGLGKGKDFEKQFKSNMEKANEYTQPSKDRMTDLGEDWYDAVGEGINRYMVPMAGVAHTIPQTRVPFRTRGSEIARAKSEVPFAKDAVAKLKGEAISKDFIDPDVKAPIPAEAQMELPDSAMAVAPQYGIHEGMGRVDENGMPIRADLSMDAQNVQNPLQRNLWGDELPGKTGDGGLPITRAIDKMPDLPWRSERDVAIGQLSHDLPADKQVLQSVNRANEEGPSMTLPKNPTSGEGSPIIPKGQRGAINMDIFDPAFQRVKELTDGIKLMIHGFEDGPYVKAMKDGKEIGWLKLGADDFVDPKPTSNMEAQFVSSTHPGLAKEMYRFASEQGDIKSAKVQTEAGKRMWEKFNQDGLAKGTMIPRSQRGAINIKDVAEGLRDMASGTAKTIGLKPNYDRPDTPNTPRSVQTIAARKELRDKVEASSLMKKLAPEYADITTPEEAIMAAKDGKDINKNPARDATAPGINWQVLNARNNPVLNFTRYALQTARNTATAFSKAYITKDKTGVANTYTKMSKQERVYALDVLKEAAVQKLELTPEVIDKLGLNENQKAYVNSVRTAMDSMWELANDYTMSQRGKPMQKVTGYLPAIFNGSYKSLVGHMKEGRFVTEAVVQSDTKWGHDKAVKFYMDKGDEKFSHVVKQPRVGLTGGMHKSDLFNGFNDIINVLAKEDERFAEIQALTNQRINDQNHKLMNFDVHELHKKGVEGYLGGKPWLDRQKNADELGKAIITYLEQGADYYAHQGALNDIGRVLTSPETQGMPNARGVAADHVKHVTGQHINPVGMGLNYALDALPKLMGVSYKYPTAVARTAKNWMSLHLMGLWNPTFMMLQWTQPLTGAVPEFLKVRGKLDIDPIQFQKSVTMAPIHTMSLKFAKFNGLDTPKHIPEHLVEAFDWAQQHGIMDFSEMELAHEATRNQTLNKVEHVAATPIRYGESLTRPPVFMTFSDLFHNFGLGNEEAFRAAQHATNIAMGDYHPAERPKIYASFGVMGEFAGALTTYKHNALGNMWLHGRDAITKDSAGRRQIAPAAAVLATGVMLYGITGSPGYDDLDSTFQWITSQMGDRKTLREAALSDVPEWGKSGLLSDATGLDFQTRASVSRIIPEVRGATLSPQLAALFDMIGKTHDYAKYRDETSFNALMKSITPAGMKGMTEDALLTDKEGYVQNPAGEQLFDEPRTENERSIRKWMAVRPLRESIEQKENYTRSLNVGEKEKTQKETSRRFISAWIRGDQAGMDRTMQMYYDAEGDPQSLFSSDAVQNALIRANQSQRERLSGRLQATIKSLNRYRIMHGESNAD